MQPFPDDRGFVRFHPACHSLDNTKSWRKGKCPVTEYFNQPVIGFGIFSLEAHHHCLWLVFHCHNKCHHFRAVCIPTGFAAFLTKINLIEREEAGQISFRRNILFFDEMIFRQIDCFICNKVRCGGKCCHNDNWLPKQFKHRKGRTNEKEIL